MIRGSIMVRSRDGKSGRVIDMCLQGKDPISGNGINEHTEVGFHDITEVSEDQTQQTTGYLLSRLAYGGSKCKRVNPTHTRREYNTNTRVVEGIIQPMVADLENSDEEAIDTRNMEPISANVHGEASKTAENLKLPLVPPYLDKHADLEHGVNFAVAGATALDQSFFAQNGIMPPFTNSSLDVQLDRFRDHISKTCGISNPSDCADKFQKSLFFVGEIGGNDYNYALLTGKSIEQVKDYVPDVVAKIIKAAKEVIDAGATHLIVPGNFAIGCMPSYLTTFRTTDSSAYDDNKCLKDLNAFAQFHNNHLKDALKDLRKDNKHVTIMYADYYHAHLYLFKKAASLGFDEDSLLKSCCGVGGEYNYDMTRMCGSPESTTCSSPSQSISWDGIHLTQEAYKIITKKLTVGGLTTPDNDLLKKWMCNNNN